MISISYRTIIVNIEHIYDNPEDEFVLMLYLSLDSSCCLEILSLYPYLYSIQSVDKKVLRKIVYQHEIYKKYKLLEVFNPNKFKIDIDFMKMLNNEIKNIKLSEEIEIFKNLSNIENENDVLESLKIFDSHFKNKMKYFEDKVSWIINDVIGNKMLKVF